MFQRKVLVLGYYHRKNLGDDSFEYGLAKFFKKRNIDYSIVNVDDLKIIERDVTAVIFGGGDLINDYFFQKIEPFISNKTCPWYAISIGIPYPSLIEKGYLDRFDYIIHRNKIDAEILKKKYGDRVQWFPDMSFLLNNKNKQKLFLPIKTKNIGVFLSRHIYENNPNYEKITDEIAKTLSNISKKVGYFKRPIYQIYLYPFCTDGKENHDDRLINRDVIKKVKKYGDLNNVHFMNEIKIEELKDLFDTFHITICNRFHSHMFSLMSKVPFLSIYNTRKVGNLLAELETNTYSYEMKTLNDIPIELNSEILLNKFNCIEAEYETYKNKIESLYNVYFNKIKEFKVVLNNLIFDKYEFLDNIDELSLNKSKEIANILSSYYNFSQNDIIYEEGFLKNYQGKIKKRKIVELISFILTNDKKSKYNYGLGEQIFSDKYILHESCKWICKDFYSPNINLNNKVETKFRKINVNTINNNLLENYHRSGWNYVMNNGIKNMHNPEGILFDGYLDRTFGWESDFLSFAKVIPYTKPWIGIFHHTSNTEYSENNLLKCFSNQKFIESLKYCKGIIVLSKNNEIWIRDKLFSYKTPVLNLFHPTEFVDKTFNYKLFKQNCDKKVIQIGAWLRDSYAIYELKVPEEYQKLVLKGKDMENYFIDDIEKVTDEIKYLYRGDERISNCLIKSDKYVNKYVLGMTEYLKNNHYSVTVLNRVDNDKYDELLTCNVVFIKLVDASAVNTILECIVRNTPILVNRLPAIEEYLGKNYPLFYDDISQAECLLKNRKNIKNAHLYLLGMDKNKFNINYFLDSLINSSLFRNL